MIKITSNDHGIEVAGVRHPEGTVNYQDDTFTDEQIEQFKQSPNLVVEHFTPPAKGTVNE